METNELPEEVKKKIYEALIEIDQVSAIRFPLRTIQQVVDEKCEAIQKVVVFALQSKEEEVTARTMELELRYAQIEHMKEQLKAKDEQNERLREALNIWQEADSLNLEMESSILNTEQRKRVISLLSQSTDKP